MELLPFVERSVEELEARRAELLAAIGMTREEFAERVRVATLTANEWDVLGEIESIDLLLGDEIREP